ncbi:hypothetical protein ACA910_004854 [Epithemia clementina (nom. ined.)]
MKFSPFKIFFGLTPNNNAVAMALCVIKCSDQPLDISFHPSNPHIVAAGLVDGTVEVHDFEEILEETPPPTTEDYDEDDEIDTIVSSTPVHTRLILSKSSESGMRNAVCRALQFSSDGTVLYTGGSDGDLVGLDASRICTFDTSNHKNNAIKWRCSNATYGSSGLQVIHEFRQKEEESDPSVKLIEEQLQNHFRTLIATGDESGGVRLWDTRLLSQQNDRRSDKSNGSHSMKRPPGCIHSWKVHEDYISGFANSSDGCTLVASSADCSISAYDLRMARHHNHPIDKVVRRSDDQEDELLSIQLMKHGRKVVCGSGEGILSIFSWGTWGDVSDRFPGHPASVDALLPVDEDTLLTGSSDGLIRVVQIHPNKLLGIMGEHEGFPIEKLKFNANRNFVGSSTHDQNIRIWDARILQDNYDHAIDHEMSTEEEQQEQQQQPTPQLKPTNGQLNNSDNEWEDMDHEDSEDGDSDGSDEDSDGANTASRSKNDKRKNRLKTEQEKFFEDL